MLEESTPLGKRATRRQDASMHVTSSTSRVTDKINESRCGYVFNSSRHLSLNDGARDMFSTRIFHDEVEGPAPSV